MAVGILFLWPPLVGKIGVPRIACHVLSTGSIRETLAKSMRCLNVGVKCINTYELIGI